MMEQITHLLHGGAHYIIPFVIVLSVVVFVHEFGHYWVARRCGIKVEAFSIGFGKEIFGWNDKHGTRWKVSWLPLGGYVKMFGDSDPASAGVDDKVKALSDEEKKVAFYTQHVAKRFAVVAAGPVTNYIFAIIVLAVLFAFNGQPYTPPLVESVMENSAAQKAGLKIGDRITMIDDQQIDRFEDVKRIISMNAGTSVRLVLQRDGAETIVNATPEVVTTTDRLGGEHRIGRLGFVSHDVEYRHLSPGQSLVEAVMETYNLTANTLKAIGQMVMGVRGTEELGGPLRIAELSGNVAKEGTAALIWFMAVISVNLGMINLFPIPLLDGGHLVFYIFEALRGRPLSERMQEYGARVGLAIVMSLMVFSTWNDLVHLRVVAYIRGLFS